MFRNRLRQIRPKQSTVPDIDQSKDSKVTLVPKWHVKSTNKYNMPNVSESQASAGTFPSRLKKHDLNVRENEPTTPKPPIQFLRPTSEPRQATLMTENGPIDVNI